MNDCCADANAECFTHTHTHTHTCKYIRKEGREQRLQLSTAPFRLASDSSTIYVYVDPCCAQSKRIYIHIYIKEHFRQGPTSAGLQKASAALRHSGREGNNQVNR